jgi:hypothetical protein
MLGLRVAVSGRSVDEPGPGAYLASGSSTGGKHSIILPRSARLSAAVCCLLVSTRVCCLLSVECYLSRLISQGRGLISHQGV